MEKGYVNYGACRVGVPGARQDIAGCSFMLAPMTEKYEEIILSAVGKVDTTRIWSGTGKLGTVYRGRSGDVLDAVRACFVHAWRPDVHMTLEMTLTKGCPGDSDDDYVLSDAPGLANEESVHDIRFPVDCKFALYSLGTENYLKDIETVVNHAVDLGIYAGVMHYASLLKGDVHQIFEYFSWLFRHMEETGTHFVIQATLSVNSPTAE